MVEPALVDICVHVLVQLLLGHIRIQRRHQPPLVHGISGIHIGGENIRNFTGAHLFIGGVCHLLDQVVHIALAESLHHDALFAAHRLVKLRYQGVKGFLLRAVIIVPDFDGGR